MRFIGDIHGKFDSYLNLISNCESSIQVGDFGIGFKPVPLIPVNHRFIRGNHDNPELCKTHPNWIVDGSFENGIFFIGGAHSIDQYKRIEGVSWWKEEEFTYAESYSMLDIYEACKPEVIVSHEAPESFINRHIYSNNESRTRQMLDSMLYIHKPALWIFGHYHRSINEKKNNTRFIGLNIEETFDINI